VPCPKHGVLPYSGLLTSPGYIVTFLPSPTTPAEPPLSLGELEGNSSRLILGRDIIKRLSFSGRSLPNLPCAGQPYEMRGEDADLEDAAKFGM
jgi:hypothetical protein